MPELDLLQRVLILAPIGRDAEATRAILDRAGIASEITPDIRTLVEEIERGSGAVIVTVEALTPDALHQLEVVLEKQPQWSELPIMVFVPEGSQDRRLSTFNLPRAHVTLVDRPIHLRTLISSAESALRSRARQIEIRDLLAKLEQAYENERRHSKRLSGLADASISIASALSLPEVLRMITEQARRLIGAQLALTRVIVDEELGSAITSVSHSEKYEAWQSHFREQKEDLKQIAGVIRGPVRRRTTDDPGSFLNEIFHQTEDLPPTRGLLAAPLAERGSRNIGFLALSNKSDGEFTEEDESVLVQLAQTASAAVVNARLYREAQDANRAKDDFLATLAHELRTPMTAILGWVQMLKSEGLTGDDVGSAISMIEASTRVQARLVEDLLDVSRIISGKLKLTPEPVELAPLVENVTTTFSSGALERDVRIVTTSEPEPLSIWGDPTRLQQIIWNLLSNAIKFTSEGGVITLAVGKEKSHACVSVTDTGQGIEPAFLPFVFERFRQGETGTMREFGGLGLGLAIVRHLTELHGGTVEAFSEGLGKGAKFTVRLPLMAVRRDGKEERRKSEFRNLHGKKVLIVDDDETAREALREVLSGIGVDALAVGSVAEAITSINEFDPDLVISDIAMPGEDGYALARRLRELNGKSIPAVALTGYGRPQDRVRILNSGFQRYVQKPVDATDLAQIAAELISG